MVLYYLNVLQIKGSWIHQLPLLIIDVNY